MIKSFIVGLLFLVAILFTSNTGYSYWKNNHTISQESIEYLMDKKYGKDQIDCIIEATYFEARGEIEDGHKAIVEVIYNRTFNSERFPDSFCEVVKQNKQFSYRNGDRKNHLVYDKEIKENISTTVYNHLYAITKSKKNVVLPDCVSHYDGKSFKKPTWAYKMNMVHEIGNHQFYCYRV